MDNPIVTLNVGGKLYQTTAATLRKAGPHSLFNGMLEGHTDHRYRRDERGSWFFDRDSDLFRHVLNFLRNEDENKNGYLVLPQSYEELRRLRAEANFFVIDSLNDGINEVVRKLKETTGDNPHYFQAFQI